MTVEKENPTTENPEQQQGEQEAVSLFDEVMNEDSTLDSTDGAEQGLDATDSGEDRETETDAGSQDEDDREQANSQQSTDGSQAQGEDSELSIEELQRQKAKLEQDHRANAGRVRALNEKLSSARETIRKLQSQQPGDVATDEEIRELEQDFPEAAKLAKAYAQRIQRDMQQQFAPIHQAVDSTLEQQQEQIRNNEFARVTQVHPDAQTIAADQRFHAWAKNASAGIQALYGSTDADDAIALLNLYKQAHGTSPQPTQQPAQQSQTGASARRSTQDRLAAHAELPRKGPSRAGVEPDDPVEVFNSIT